MHEQRARHLVEAVERAVVQPEPQRAREREQFRRTDLHPLRAQIEEKIDEH